MLVLAVVGWSYAAGKPTGRAEPRIFDVPGDVLYEVRSYREGEHPRAGQVGIAV